MIAFSKPFADSGGYVAVAFIGCGLLMWGLSGLFEMWFQTSPDTQTLTRGQRVACWFISLAMAVVGSAMVYWLYTEKP